MIFYIFPWKIDNISFSFMFTVDNFVIQIVNILIVTKAVNNFCFELAGTSIICHSRFIVKDSLLNEQCFTMTLIAGGILIFAYLHKYRKKPLECFPFPTFRLEFT